LPFARPNFGLPGNPAIVVCVVMQEFNAADCGQNTVEEVEDRLVSADQRAFATCGIEWSAQRRILGLRSLRHVFRRDAIEVRLHTLLSRVVVHSRLFLFWHLQS